MEDDIFLGKWPSKYQARIAHKKHLAHKKQHQEKQAWLWNHSEASPTLFSDATSGELWRVSEIQQIPSVARVVCFSEVSGVVRVLESAENNITSSVVIGDFLILKENMIQNIVTRSNMLARFRGDGSRFSLHKRVLQPIAVNLDFIVIVASARNPKFQPGFIDRYALLAESCQIPVILTISKSDLMKIDDPILDWYESHLSIPVVYTSTSTWEGIDTLEDLIRGKTVVFVWKSGVGKSSLVNTVLWSERIITSSVSAKWWQWRHTTTTSSMHEWSEWSYIIDTPWIRSLDFLEFSGEELKFYFPEFIEPAKSCRYRDCLHQGETDCGVKDAVHAGIIPESRYTTYLRLLGEVLP